MSFRTVVEAKILQFPGPPESILKKMQKEANDTGLTWYLVHYLGEHEWEAVSAEEYDRSIHGNPIIQVAPHPPQEG